MKALVGAFNQEKALVRAFSVIVVVVVEPMDRFAALDKTRVARAAFYIRIQLHHTHTVGWKIFYDLSKAPRLG